MHVGSRRSSRHLSFSLAADRSSPWKLGEGRGWWLVGGAGAGAVSPSELWLCEGASSPASALHMALLSLLTLLLPVPSGAPGSQPPPHLFFPLHGCADRVACFGWCSLAGRGQNPKPGQPGTWVRVGGMRPVVLPPASPAGCRTYGLETRLPTQSALPITETAQLSVHAHCGDPPPDPTVSLTPLPTFWE